MQHRGDQGTAKRGRLSTRPKNPQGRRALLSHAHIRMPGITLNLPCQLERFSDAPDVFAVLRQGARGRAPYAFMISALVAPLFVTPRTS